MRDAEMSNNAVMQMLAEKMVDIVKRITTKRMLSIKEAAAYCDLPKSTFKRICPIRPIQLCEGVPADYDRKDLDRWIESRKGNVPESNNTIDDAINQL